MLVSHSSAIAGVLSQRYQLDETDANYKRTTCVITIRGKYCSHIDIDIYTLCTKFNRLATQLSKDVEFDSFFGIKVHEEFCKYGDVQCKACGEAMERRHLEQHRTKDCINRTAVCAYCSEMIRNDKMKV